MKLDYEALKIKIVLFSQDVITSSDNEQGTSSGKELGWDWNN